MHGKFEGGGIPDAPRMNQDELEDLLVFIMRVSAVYIRARENIQLEDWDPHIERHYRILIDCLFKLGDSKLYAVGDFPYLAVHNSVRIAMDDDPMLRDAPHLISEIVGRPTDADEYRGLLYQAYRLGEEQELHAAYGLELLRKFLRERQVSDKVRQMVVGAAGRTISDFDKFLRKIVTRAQAVDAIGSNPYHRMLPENWVPTRIETTGLSIPWLDEMMGGQAPGDVNGILGPFGGGKTMLGMQVGVERSKFCMALHKSGAPGHEKPRRIIFASYEENAERDVRPRAMAYSALIKKDRLENLVTMDQLSRKGHLLPYEVEMYKKAHVTDQELMDGEYERLMKADKQIEDSLTIVNMTGAGRGMGWIPELVSYIEQGQQEDGRAIDTIIIDYTKLICRRYLKAQDKDPDRHLRHLINETPMMAKTELAERFGCTVWLLQQLSGEANTRSPTAPLSHAHAGEARDFAENLVNCIVIGVKDSSTNCSRVFYTKGRRSANQGATTLVILDGAFGRILSATGKYTIANDKIVNTKEYNKIHAGPNPITVGGPSIEAWNPTTDMEGDE